MKPWLKENWFKASLALAVILIGTSFSYYYVYFLPHKAAQEQAAKDTLYVAERKKDCYDILERERKAFSNTKDGGYDEKADVCRITYEAVQGEWKGKDCETFKPSGALVNSAYFWRLYGNCKQSIFDKEY